MALGINNLRVSNRSTLTSEIKSFHEGKQSLILAFRHTAKEDAPALLVAVKESHLCFLYGRDVLNWAGSVTKFLFPRLGFVAVQNRGSNREGMHFLRKEVQHGRFPIALAPEGQVTYHSHRCENIEMGVANIASWALESGKDVAILPIAIGYRYTGSLKALLTRWTEETGLGLTPGDDRSLLQEACTKTLELVASFFHLPLSSDLPFTERRDSLCRSLLNLGEQKARLEASEETILDRLFRLRYKGEDTLFNQNEDNLNAIDAANLAYEQAAARSYLRISQVVDILEYLNPGYIDEGSEQNRFFEVALNILDVNNRLMGGSINTRYSPKGKRATLHIGEPIRFQPQEIGKEGRRKRLTAIHKAVYSGLQQVSKDLEP